MKEVIETYGGERRKGYTLERRGKDGEGEQQESRQTETDCLSDKQGQMGRGALRQTDRDRQTGRRADRDRQTGRRADRDRQTGRQASR